MDFFSLFPVIRENLKLFFSSNVATFIFSVSPIYLGILIKLQPDFFDVFKKSVLFSQVHGRYQGSQFMFYWWAGLISAGAARPRDPDSIRTPAGAGETSK